MKKMTCISLILFLLTSGALFSVSKRVDYTANGFTLSLSDIDFSISGFDNPGKSYVELDNSSALFRPDEKYALQSLSYQICVPGYNKGNPDEAITYNITRNNKKSVGNFGLISLEEYYKLKYKDYSPAEINTFNDKSVNIKYLGVQRSNNLFSVYINPFEYNEETGELFVYENIEVDFAFKNPLSQNNLSADIIANFFPNVLNKKYIRDIEKASSKSDRQLSETWYNPDFNYLKLKTEKDGIAHIDADDIIGIDNSFKGVDISGLHLIYKGEEYPVFIRNDKDGIFNEGDEIYFYGRRPTGDTTWFDHYDGSASFFLYVDNTTSGLRYQEFQDADASEELEFVDIDYHFEKDLIYYLGWGTSDNDYMTIEAEKWYWDTLNSKNGEPFEYNGLMLVHEPGTDIKLSLQLSSHERNLVEWEAYPGLKHHLDFSFNNKKILTDSFKVLTAYENEFNFNGNNLVSGYNSLNIFNPGYIGTKGTMVEPDIVGLDYFEVEGSIKPYAINGLMDCDIKGQDKNVNVTFKGFGSTDIIALDTLNRMVKDNFEFIKGSRLVCGGFSGDAPYVTLDINNEKYISKDEKGLHIGYLTDAVNFEYYPSYSESLKSLIESLPDGTPIAIVFNGDNSDNYKNVLKSIGSTQIDGFLTGSAWAMACRKNISGQIVESLDATNTSADAFYEHNDGISYAVEMGFEAGSDYSLWISDSENFEKASIETIHKSDLHNTENNADLLIITHSLFKESADALAEYRRETHPDYNVKVVDVEDTYNEFYYGGKSPHAIKNFIDYAYHNWQVSPSYVILYGDASWDSKQVYESSTYPNYVPSYGRPVSDFWYTQVDGDDPLPDVVLGRIPVNYKEDGDNYVEKVKMYESVPNNPWMKRFLHLSGGSTDTERIYFASRSKTSMSNTVYNSELCVDTIIIRKRDPDVAGEQEANEIMARVNEGVGFVSFLGHGATTVFDMDGWGHEKLSNKDKYGLFVSISCNTGNFGANNVRTRNEDYIFAPNTGFVAAIGGTSTGWVDIGSDLMRKYLKLLADSSQEMRSFGVLLNEAKKQMLMEQDDKNVNIFLNEFLLTADPLLKFKITIEPDLYLIDNELEISTESGTDIILSSDSSVTLSGYLRDMGYQVHDPVDLILIREYDENADTISYTFDGICKDDAFEFKLDVNNKPGTHVIKIIADPDEMINDPDRANNQLTIDLEVFNEGLIALDPLPYWNIDKDAPVFRVISPDYDENASVSYEFRIGRLDQADNSIVYSSKEDEVTVHEPFIEWKPDFVPEEGEYWFFSRETDVMTGNKTPWLTIPINIKSGYENEKSGWQQANTFNGADANLENMSSDDNKIYMNKEDLSYDIIGVTGNGTEGDDDFVEKGVGITFNDIIYLTTPPVERGFHSILISGDTYEFIDSRRWDTWGEAYNPLDDEAGINMIKYIRDTVPEGDYLFLASCEQSFRLFVEHSDTLKYPGKYSPGAFDTLRAALKEYGSVLADSLVYGCSYVMMGRKGYPEEINEDFDVIWENPAYGKIYHSDTARVQGFITKYDLQGSFTSTKIGPAREWKQLNIQGYFPKDSTALTVNVYGYSKLTSEKELLITDSLPEIDITGINALEYPDIQVELDISRINGKARPYIESIDCDFIPAAEFAVLKSATEISNNDFLRGSETELSATVSNISPRSESSPSELLITVNSENGQVLLSEGIPIPGLDTDETYSVSYEPLTDYLELSNIVKFEMNSQKESNEIYYGFNNNDELVLNMLEDSVKPYIEVYHDSRLLHDSDYIAMSPNFEIWLYDNSPLLISSPEFLKARMNSRVIDSDYSPDYEFESFDKSSTPLKAVLRFSIDSLTERHNRLSLYIGDVTGNRDTVKYNVYISRSGYVESLYNYPNPVSETANFKFYYKAPRQGASAQISIYDMSGRRVSELDNKDIFIGENEISWDGRDQNGNTLPSGVYVYLLTVNGDVWVEAVTGKLMIVN